MLVRLKKPSSRFIAAPVFALFLSTATAVKAQDDFEAMASMVNLMESFLDLMNSVHDMNADNEKALLLQMHAIEEIYKEQGRHGEAVAVYRKVLDNSRNSTVRNMAYHRMADVLKESGDRKAAIEVLEAAMAESLEKTR